MCHKIFFNEYKLYFGIVGKLLETIYLVKLFVNFYLIIIIFQNIQMIPLEVPNAGHLDDHLCGISLTRNLLDVELETLPGEEESVPMLGAGA